MSSPWKFFEKKTQQTSEDSNQEPSFQSYVTHPQAGKPLVLQAEVKETRTIAPEEMRAPLKPLQADTSQTQLPAHLDEFRERDGHYDINAYINKYGDTTPLLAGFKRQYTNYPFQRVAVQEGIDMYGTLRQEVVVQNNNLTVLHQYDLAIPVGLPDGVPLNFRYRRIDNKQPVDLTSTRGTIHTDYTVEPGKPHRYFMGTATFTLVDGTQSHTRAVCIPLNRYYPDRKTEVTDLKRWFSVNNPGDDEFDGSCPNLYAMPKWFQDIFKYYPKSPLN